MTQKITIKNKLTAWERTKYHLGLVFVGLTCYAGYLTISSWYENNKFKKNYASVENAINSGDRKLAETSLTEFKEKGLLREREIVKLRASLTSKLNQEYNSLSSSLQSMIDRGDYEKAKALLERTTQKSQLREVDEQDLRNTLENALNKRELTKNFENKILLEGVNNANRILTELRSTGLFNDAEITAFENKVSSYTETGFLTRVTNSNGEEKIQLTDQYLRMYPNGTNKKQIIKEVLVDQFSVLTNYLSNNRLLNQTYSHTVRLNSLLEQNSKENINLAGLVNIETLLASASTYSPAETSSAELIEGSSVIVSPLRAEETGLGADYVEQRDVTFSPGSTGTIVGITDEKTDFYVVEFPNITEYYWGESQWGPLLKYWKEDKKNVGAYHKKELQAIISNPVQKVSLEQELQKLKELMQNYNGQ